MRTLIRQQSGYENPWSPCTADILDGDTQYFHQTVDWLLDPENMQYRDLTTFPLDSRLATRSQKYCAIGCPNKTSTDLKIFPVVKGHVIQTVTIGSRVATRPTITE